MLRNMDLLCGLPEDTQVYCGHEYTLANLRFLRSIALAPSSNTTASGSNSDSGSSGRGSSDMSLQDVIDTYYQRAVELRDDCAPTLPSTLADERRYNLFVKCREPGVQRALHCAGDPTATMKKLREMKNNF